MTQAEINNKTQSMRSWLLDVSDEWKEHATRISDEMVEEWLADCERICRDVDADFQDIDLWCSYTRISLQGMMKFASIHPDPVYGRGVDEVVNELRELINDCGKDNDNEGEFGLGGDWWKGNIDE